MPGFEDPFEAFKKKREKTRAYAGTDGTLEVDGSRPEKFKTHRAVAPEDLAPDAPPKGYETGHEDLELEVEPGERPANVETHQAAPVEVEPGARPDGFETHLAEATEVGEVERVTGFTSDRFDGAEADPGERPKGFSRFDL